LIIQFADAVVGLSRKSWTDRRAWRFYISYL